VGVTDEFMNSVKGGTHYSLINPRNNEIVGELDAREVFSKMVYGAWRNGEPGMVFLDTINTDNHVISKYGRIIATNPCGEQPLLGNESCNLGSINLANFVKSTARSSSPEPSLDWKTTMDWFKLDKTVRMAVRFLDNVIDANYYATPEIEEMTKSTRKIGLGIMGFADLLIQLRVGYSTDLGRYIGNHIMGFVRDIADNESMRLATARGVFPAWDESDYAATDRKYRNACRLTVAPTGTISMLANTSSSIEPTFALAWKKMNILGGETLHYVNKYFEQDAKEHNFYSQELMEYISGGGSIQSRDDVPEWIKRIYVTAGDISPEAHVLMQAAFQQYCDSGISKTINFSNDANIEDVYTAYMLAWEKKCKGITVYRAGSREKEVLVKSDTSVAITDTLQLDFLNLVQDPVLVASGECCDNPFQIDESGCVTCKSCGWSKCVIA
jgi:ribonucleoside-diphosphate reductase alpha chain